MADKMVKIQRPALVIGNSLGDRTEVKDYDDTWSFRLGAEYKFSDTWAGRLGYAYDPSPVPDETIDYMLPDSDRHLFSIGMGFRYKKFASDACFLYMNAEERHIDARPENYISEGDSELSAMLIGLTFSYAF
jgi:long-chain fatty acid transport protein